MGLKPYYKEVVLPEEYQIKAIFLYNFAQFVQWPERSFPSKDSPLIISVLGKDPFGKYLEEVVSGEKLNDHPLIIKKYNQLEEVNECHILFIEEKDKGELRIILDDLLTRNILTVSDIKGFAQMGGMIEFIKTENKIALKINHESVNKAELTISSKLLRLAEIVSRENDQ